MSLQWCDEAASYVEELVSEGTPNVDYVLFQLDNPKSKNPKMELFAKGKGGRSQVEMLLLEETDKVVTGAFLASAIDERGSIMSVRRKYIHVIWVGTRVSIMTKGKVNTQLAQPFKDRFPGCAMYLQLADGDLDDLQAAVLEKTLLAVGGAHKPTRYSFTNRTLIGSLQLDDSSFNNEEERRREEEERRLAALADARKRASQAEAKRKAEAEAKRIAEEEARRRSEAERRRVEEEKMAKLKAQEEARLAREAAEQEARLAREVEEEARLAAEEARRQKAYEEELAREAEEEEARRRKAYDEEQKLKALTPKAALSDKTFLMLISSMSGNMATSANQALAKSILTALEVELEVIDGADPTRKELRNELFTISGLRGKYPQFFLRQKNGTIKFFGDFETLAYYNDTGTLAQQIGGCATPKNKSAMETTTPSMVSTLNGNKLLLLISSMSGKLEVSSNQTRVQGILKGLHLPKEQVEIMDGCDPDIRDRRNELFGISGIRAKYPQLFLVNVASGKTSFVGNYDDISYLHDTNTFAQAVGLTTKKAAVPTIVSTLNGKKFLLLISSMSGSLEVSSNQTRVEGILKGLHLPKEEVEIMDGCDAAVKDRRNELFGISGLRAKYPQLFLVDTSSGETTFVGNYDDISYLQDTNTLAEAVGLTTKTETSVASAPGTTVTAANTTGGDQAKEEKEVPSTTTAPPEASAAPPTTTSEPTTSTDQNVAPKTTLAQETTVPEPKEFSQNDPTSPPTEEAPPEKADPLSTSAAAEETPKEQEEQSAQTTIETHPKQAPVEISAEQTEAESTVPTEPPKEADASPTSAVPLTPKPPKEAETAIESTEEEESQQVQTKTESSPPAATVEVEPPKEQTPAGPVPMGEEAPAQQETKTSPTAAEPAEQVLQAAEVQISQIETEPDVPPPEDSCNEENTQQPESPENPPEEEMPKSSQTSESMQIQPNATEKSEQTATKELPQPETALAPPPEETYPSQLTAPAAEPHFEEIQGAAANTSAGDAEAAPPSVDTDAETNNVDESVPTPDAAVSEGSYEKEQSAGEQELQAAKVEGIEAKETTDTAQSNSTAVEGYVAVVGSEQEEATVETGTNGGAVENDEVVPVGEAQAVASTGEEAVEPTTEASASTQFEVENDAVEAPDGAAGAQQASPSADQALPNIGSEVTAPDLPPLVASESDLPADQE